MGGNMKQDNHTRYQVQEGPTEKGQSVVVSRKYKTFDGAQNAADQRMADNGERRGVRVVTVPADGYHFEDCTGEAHSNAFIDNCMVCMPMWGQVVVQDRIPTAFEDSNFGYGPGAARRDK
jgi:hypothetical protein